MFLHRLILNSLPELNPLRNLSISKWEFIPNNDSDEAINSLLKTWCWSRYFLDVWFGVKPYMAVLYTDWKVFVAQFGYYNLKHCSSDWSFSRSDCISVGFPSFSIKPYLDCLLMLNWYHSSSIYMQRNWFTVLF